MKKGGLLSSSILKSKRGKKPPKLQLASSLIYFFCFHKYKKKRPFFFGFCQQPYYIELYTSFFLLAILYILEAFLFEWNALLVRQTTDLQFNEFFEVTFSIKRQRNLKISTFTICKHDAFLCQSSVGTYYIVYIVYELNTKHNCLYIKSIWQHTEDQLEQKMCQNYFNDSKMCQYCCRFLFQK